ncbi:MAG: hypothetical protein ACTJIC_05530 [Enterococcus viikkiensis]
MGALPHHDVWGNPLLDNPLYGKEHGGYLWIYKTNGIASESVDREK